MRTLLLVAAATIVSSPAQSPLGMPFTANNGLSAGTPQVYFDLTVLDPNGLTITSFDVNAGTTAVGTVGTVEVYTGPSTFVGNELIAASWSLVSSGGVTAAGNNLPSPLCLGTGVFLTPGSHGIMMRHIGVGLRYTNGTGTNQAGATTELTLQAGASLSGAFTGTYFNPRVFNGNIYYVSGNAPVTNCASRVSYGTGCYFGAVSWYENFLDLQSFDLAGGVGTERVVNAGNIGALGHVVQSGASAWRTPSGTTVLSNAATPVAMGDDSMSQPLALPFSVAFPGGSTSVVHANANGYIVLGSTTATTGDATPTTVELLAQQPRLCPLWCNLHPGTNLPSNPASGIYFDVDPSNQSVYVTWLDVADRRTSIPAAGATSVNVQCAIHANGQFEFRYRTIVPNTSTLPVIVGWSSGNATGSAAVDPGSRDLTAAMPFLTSGPDSLPLTLDSNFPRLNSNFVLTTTRIPASSPLAFLFHGDTIVNPGIGLAFLGAPDCSDFTNANITTSTFAAVAGMGTVTFALPNNPAFVGAALTTQAVTFSSQNALGLIMSNGLAWTIGN
ncbi:MAG: hypothetical protein ABIP94_04510 [Planctomycetota bacterium]